MLSRAAFAEGNSESLREWELSASRRSVIFTKFHFHGHSERSNVADECLIVLAFAADFALQGLFGMGTRGHLNHLLYRWGKPG